MLHKFFYLSFILLLAICTNIHADTLKLENFGEKIDVKILGMNEGYIKVVVPQRVISSISLKSQDDDKYPDTVFIKVDDKEDKVVCKIVKITKKPGSITLQIPREKVAAIQIAFPGSENDTGSNQRDTLAERRRESVPPPVDTERLKEQIKKELRLEFEEKQAKKQEKDDVAIEEKIKEELRVEFENKEKVSAAENYGRVAGRMLAKGKALPGCKVKIIMLEQWGMFGKTKEGLRFETITDENGRYLFEKVPPGGYKLYWKPPGETSWVRSINMKPEIFVEAGETYHFRDRETNIKTVN
ncbi:MAG: carboxypeptidase-like regulatory domain-containing protein [Candidatus Scalindua sp.]